jgi:transcriptional regulator with XRE-family HTH domain
MKSIPSKGMKVMSNDFGNALGNLRRELGWSQAKFADELNSTQRHISFLETGRSQPSRQMIGRLVTDLNLSAGQRASLFDASGYRNPYKRRSFSSQEVTEALDMIEFRVLKNWPFPAFVMDADWTVLRMNNAAKGLLAAYADPVTGRINMFSVFLSDMFRQQVDNWADVSSTVYYRLQSAASHSDVLHAELARARENKIFDEIAKSITDTDEIPIFVPITMRLPNGARLKLTSLLGQLVSIHDALVEGFEVELMVPADAESEALLRMMGGQ